MTVAELIDLLSRQPGDYEIAVRTINHESLSIWDDAITGLAEVRAPDDDTPGFVVLDYEGNETGELPDDDDDLVVAETQKEPELEDSNSLIEGPDGRKWTWEQFEAWIISLTIRNTLEMFHGGGAMNPEDPAAPEGFITDRQMKALNIVIRYTVYDMVSALTNLDGVIDEELGFTNADRIGLTLRYINSYMEPPGSPELDEAYRRIKDGKFDPPEFVPDCTSSSPEG